MLENSGVFKHSIFVSLKGIASVASRGRQSDRHLLENTGWYFSVLSEISQLGTIQETVLGHSLTEPLL